MYSLLCGLFPSCGERAYSRVAAPGLQSTGSIVVVHGWVAPRHVGSSQIRDWTHVSCTGRRILHHWASSEAPRWCISNTLPSRGRPGFQWQGVRTLSSGQTHFNQEQLLPPNLFFTSSVLSLFWVKSQEKVNGWWGQSYLIEKRQGWLVTIWSIK